MLFRDIFRIEYGRPGRHDFADTVLLERGPSPQPDAPSAGRTRRVTLDAVIGAGCVLALMVIGSSLLAALHMPGLRDRADMADLRALVEQG